MDYLKELDDILLGENVKDNFKVALNNKEFSGWLYEILPEIKDCARQKQNNPWHIYNVLDHILVSVDKMNEQTQNFEFKDRRLLAYTMFLHDIAKPKCHIERVKNGKKIDSFFANGGHAIHSAKIAKKVAGEFGFDENEKAKLVKLVEDHDVFMNLTLNKTSNPYLKQLDESVVGLKIEEFNRIGDGEKLANMLVLVGIADSGAQNPKMTGPCFELLDKYNEYIDQVVSEGVMDQ